MFFEECNFLDYTVRNELKEIIPDSHMSEYCEMSAFESALICGLIRKTNPKNILEVGVASGGTSSIILHAIQKYDLDTQLISIDIAKDWYRKKEVKPTGWQVIDRFGEINNWTLFTGSYLPELIVDFDTNFDLCIIDTVHMLPGELLDYLVAIKFMKLNGYMIFHDTQLFHTLLYYPRTYATKVILDTCVGDKLYFNDHTSKLGIPNIGGFKIIPDTYKYLDNSFSALSMKWAYCIDDKQFQIYKHFYTDFYGKNYGIFFEKSYINNKEMIEYQNSAIR